MKNIISILLNLLPLKTVYAHCDIPCGIYDPYLAQRAAHTILRMTNLLIDIKDEDFKKLAHDISRMTRIKEDHANILEEELETLRNDYFKEEHFKTYPNLDELFKTVFKSAAKARQGIDLKAAEDVLVGVQEIAEIFFKTKNVEPIRVKSVYPTGSEIVLHK